MNLSWSEIMIVSVDECREMSNVLYFDANICMYIYVSNAHLDDEQYLYTSLLKISRL